MKTAKQIQQKTEQSDNKRQYERYLAVRLHLRDRTNTEIADILGRTYQSVNS